MVLGVFSLSFDHHLEAYDATSKIQFQPCKLRFLHFLRKSLITATRKCQNNCHSQMGWIDFAILRRQYFRWSTYVPNITFSFAIPCTSSPSYNRIPSCHSGLFYNSAFVPSSIKKIRLDVSIQLRAFFRISC